MLVCASWTLSLVKLISRRLEFESCLENADLTPQLGHVSNCCRPIGNLIEPLNAWFFRMIGMDRQRLSTPGPQIGHVSNSSETRVLALLGADPSLDTLDGAQSSEVGLLIPRFRPPGALKLGIHLGLDDICADELYAKLINEDEHEKRDPIS